MFDSLFDLPILVTGPAILAILCLFSLGGLWLVRRHILPRLRISADDSEFSGAMLQSVMVFYGLAVALIAVQVFQSHSDASKLVSGEATSLAALYRDVSSYPESIRPRLQGELRDYVRYVIDEAWPMQRRGQVPGAGVERLDRLQSMLTGFEPASEGQKALHAETLHAYNEMIQARRLRLDALDSGLPAVMWIVIVFGAFIGLGAAFFFEVPDARLHAIQVLLLAAFIALVVFMTFALDRPFRGDLGLGSEPYQLIYDHLMKGKS